MMAMKKVAVLAIVRTDDAKKSSRLIVVGFKILP